MKKLIPLAGALALVLLAGCVAGNPTATTSMQWSLPGGAVKYSGPKDMVMTNLLIEVTTNGTKVQIGYVSSIQNAGATVAGGEATAAVEAAKWVGINGLVGLVVTNAPGAIGAAAGAAAKTAVVP
jgi:hypothetical protein